MAPSKLSRGPCCEINKLIVQVTGNNHPPSQRLAFYDQAGKRLDTLTAEDKPETLKKPYFVDSALHVWSWKNHYTHRLWLKIDSVDGSPIPGRYLCDLSGQFPVIALSAARQHVVRCEKGETAYQPTSVETGAWAHWLEQVCNP